MPQLEYTANQLQPSNAKLKLRSYLIILVAAAMVPLLIFAGGLIVAFQRQARATQERILTDRAYALSYEVDRILITQLNNLQALATSKFLDSGDLRQFHDQAVRTLEAYGGVEAIALVDLSGQQVVNTGFPFGNSLAPIRASKTFDEVVQTGRPVISDLFFAPVVKKALFTLSVPVLRDDKVKYVLVSSVPAALLTDMLLQQALPLGRLATVIDENGVIVARNQGIEKFLGQPSGPSLAATVDKAADGLFLGVTFEGIKVATGFRRSALSGWTVTVEMPVSMLEAPMRRSLILFALGGFALLLLGIGVALFFGRRIARAYTELSRAAATMGRGETPGLHPLPVAEANELARAFENAAKNRNQMEAALRQSQLRLAGIVDTAMDAIISLDARHRIVLFNAAAEKMFGRSALEVVGQTLDQLIPERLRGAHSEHVRRFVQTGVSCDQMGTARTLRGLRADGREFPIEASAISQSEIGGERVFTVILRDITERKRAEEAVQARQRQLEMLHAISEHVLKSPDLSAILEGILDKTLALGYFDIGVIRLSEPGSTEIRAVALRGYRRPEAQRNRTIDLANSGPGALYSRVILNKEVKVIEDVSSLPGFSVFKEEGVQSAIMAPILEGQELLGTILLGSRIPRKFPLELIGTIEALSNHMGIAIQKTRLHEETQTSLDRIRALHEIETAITSTLDLQSVLDMLLEKVELFLPVAAASTVRLHNPSTGTLEALASRGRAQEISKLGGRSTRIMETQVPLAVLDIHKDPHTLNPSRYAGLVSYLGVPLIAHKMVLGVLSIYSRVEHEFSKAEIEFLETLAGQAAIAIHNARLFEQISKQARDLESANTVKDEFLAVMSHELRTPLSITMGYTGMMKEGLLGEITPEQEDALQKVLNQSAVQLRMVNDIMETTYFESRTVAIERQLINLSDFFRHLKLDIEAIHEKNQTALVWEYPQEPMPIVTDSRKLRQIVQNLISNALKFTDQGKVTVSAQTVSRSPTLPLFDSESSGQNGLDQWLEIKVWDTGRGIPPDKLDAIFDKFYQLDTSETRLCGGLGLGLYITKKFAELLGGKITVESEINEGSTFTVTIPYVS